MRIVSWLVAFAFLAAMFMLLVAAVLLLVVCFMLFTWTKTAHAAELPSGYEQSNIPPEHTAWVSRFDLIDRNDYGATFHDRRVELPRKPDMRILRHEIGHIVAIVRPDLEADYCRQFKGTKKDCHERFAEAYRGILEGRDMPNSERQYMVEILKATGSPRQEVQAPAISLQTLEHPNPCGSVIAGAIVSGCSIVPGGSVR